MNMQTTLGTRCSCRSATRQILHGRPLAHRPQPCKRSLQRLVRASGAPNPAPKLSEGNGSQSIIKESDLTFVGKLVALSFTGAIVIKYGSLLISLPFEPSPAVAAGVVLGTPALYSLYLLTQSTKQQ